MRTKKPFEWVLSENTVEMVLPEKPFRKGAIWDAGKKVPTQIIIYAASSIFNWISR